MQSTYQSNLTRNYLPLIEIFLQNIKGIELSNLPEPHLPVIGQDYGGSKAKILFMGWETRGSKGLKEFCEVAKNNPEEVLLWWKEEFEELDFVYWRTNFSKDFWSFNLRFLAKYYEIENWKDLIKNPFDYEEILSSFAWANSESVERYEVTAQKMGVSLDNWKILKDSSKVFDNPSLLLKTLEPELVILMNWDQNEQELLNGLEIEEEKKIHPDYLWYYKTKNPAKIIFWTKHPLRLHFEGIDYDKLIDEMISIFKSNS